MKPETGMDAPGTTGAPVLKLPPRGRQAAAEVDVTSVPGILSALLREREGLLTQIFTRKVELNRILGLLAGIFLALAGFYGFVLGLGSTVSWEQAASSAVKAPLIYLLSLAVCLPVLYIINIQMGSRLGFRQTVGLILVAFNLNAILLASCSPIVAFFIATGSNYHFLKILNVVIMGFGGIWAMLALYRALVAMCENSDVYPRRAVSILLVWILIFGFVGTQMAWRLRPFLGAPDLKFEILRQGGEMNFYTAVFHSLRNL